MDSSDFKQALLESPKEFEKYLTGWLLTSPEFFGSIQEYFCVRTVGKKNFDTNEFDTNVAYWLYLCLKQYNSLAIKGGDTKNYVTLSNSMLKVVALRLANNAQISLSDIDAIIAYHKECLDMVSPLTETIVKEVFSDWCAKKRISKLMDDFKKLDTYDPKVVAEEVNKVIELTSSVNLVDKMTFVEDHIWVDDEQEVECARTPLEELNARMDGGLAKQESMLVIAPSGGGKTVIACQFAAHWGFQLNKKVLVITMEAPPSNITNRIVSNLAKIQFNYINRGVTHKAVDKHCPDRSGQVDIIKNKLKSNIALADWTSVQNFDKSAFMPEINKAINKMDGLDFIIFDWLGFKLSKDGEESSITAARYVSANEFLCQTIPKTYNVGIVVLTQAKKEFDKLQFIDSGHCPGSKSLMQPTDFVLGISALKNISEQAAGGNVESDEQFGYLSKARRTGKVGWFKLRRQFEFMRFSG